MFGMFKLDLKERMVPALFTVSDCGGNVGLHVWATLPCRHQK